MDIQDYSRGRNNENSKLAFEKIKNNVESNRITVYKKVDGVKSTLDIATEMGVSIHQISGRFSELRAKQKIYQTSSKKIGSKSYAVYSKSIN